MVDATQEEVPDFLSARLIQIETANRNAVFVTPAIRDGTFTAPVLSCANHAFAVWALFLLLGLLTLASTSVQSVGLERAALGECASTNDILALAFANISVNISSVEGFEDSR